MLRLLNKNFIYAISAALTGLTIFFVYVTYSNIATPENIRKSSAIKVQVVKDCAKKAEEFGFERVSPKTGGSYVHLEIKQTKVEDPMDYAVKSSMLQKYCHKLELKSFCLGNECKIKSNDSSSQFNMVFVAN